MKLTINGMQICHLPGQPGQLGILLPCPILF